jgi:hypothetical protein
MKSAGGATEISLITVECYIGFGRLTAHYWFPCFTPDKKWFNAGYLYLAGTGL